MLRIPARLGRAAPRASGFLHMGRGRSMRRNAWLLGVVSLLLLSGCDPDSGQASIEVGYPSGYVRTSGTWDELTPEIGRAHV